MASINVKERDVVSWLEKKVCATSSYSNNGTATELSGLWGSRHVCSLVNQEMLTEIPSCFVDLQTSTKLKLLLSMLHLTKRNLDQWRDEIEEILTLASQDTDEWVQTIAELLKELPTTGGLSLNMSNDESQFAKAVQLLKKILKKQGKDTFQILPLDASFVNKTTLNAIWGSNVPPSKHFALKRKPKAAAQRIELLQKSIDVSLQLKNKSRSSMSTMAPIRERNTIRKMDTNGPLPKIPTTNAVKASAGFGSSKVYSRPLPTKKEGGVKLIDIGETPEMVRKRQRETELQEKAAKKAAKEETKRVKLEVRAAKKSRISESVDEEALMEDVEEEENVDFVPPTPNYAADLADASLLAAPTNTDDSNKPQQTIPSNNSLRPPATISSNFPSSMQTFISPAMLPNEIAITDPFRAANSVKNSLSSDIQTPVSSFSSNFASAAPYTYSNFANAFVQPQLSAKPQPLVNTTIAPALQQVPMHISKAGTQQHFQQVPSFNVPTTLAPASGQQNLQMMRITLGGQPQTVILQNPNSSQPMQQNRFYLLGQGGMAPTTSTAPNMMSSSAAREQQNAGRKNIPLLPGSTDVFSPNLQPIRPQPSSQLHQQHFRENLSAGSSGAPVFIQPAPSNGVGKASGSNLLPQQTPPSINVTQNSAATPSSPAQIILTKDIMYQAQEMFRTANKLSRPEKALILGFMAGNRENPCPQMGNILTVRLSENQEDEVRQDDGRSYTTMVETFFQMNYESGEWKKIRKVRHLPRADS